MIRQRIALNTWALVVIDILSFIVFYFLSFYIRGSLPPYEIHNLWYKAFYLRFFLISIPVWMFFLFYQRPYPLKEVIERKDIYIRALKAVGESTVIIIFILYLTHSFSQSRLFLGIFTILMAIAIVISRFVYFKIIENLRIGLVNVLIIGTGREAEIIKKYLESGTHLGIKITGFLKIKNKKKVISENLIIGKASSVEKILKDYPVDWVIFAPSSQFSTRLMDNIFSICEDLGISISFPFEKIRYTRIAQPSIDNLNGDTLITYHTTTQEYHLLFLKYLIDRIVAFVLIILLLPVFLIISISIKLYSKGNVIYKQERIGLNGRKFIFYKFRTMYEGAEKMKLRLLHLNEMDGVVFKMHNDPRVTPVGTILRRFSLDELPQLWNVLKGDMSLVGPRPPLEEEVKVYKRQERRRLSMKPGLTCIWQISGRNEINFKEWINIDLKYIDNWSLSWDIMIILKTIPAILSGRGAY